MVSISLCMIVKNEEAVLSRCLNCLSDIVDEIIIVDTGSTDQTIPIAKRYTNQVYNFTWQDDFSKARNFAFSKAHCDYIYSADADEIIDSANIEKFKTLKSMLLPEIEIVQMIYDEKGTVSTVLNATQELRPKLYKRVRSFTWIDPIHETVRTDPVVYDSDIVIFHRPIENHTNRDFRTFEATYEKTHYLSPRIFTMYMKELYRWGDLKALERAANIIKDMSKKTEFSEARLSEASIILARYHRLAKNGPEFMKAALRIFTLMQGTPCSEICCELALYYEQHGDLPEAKLWYINAKDETEPILDIKSGKEIPEKALLRLGDA